MWPSAREGTVVIKVTAKVAEESDEEGNGYLGKYPRTTQIS